MLQGDQSPMDEGMRQALSSLVSTREGAYLVQFLDTLRTRHVEVCCHRSGDDLLRSQGAVQVIDDIEGTLKRLDRDRR